MLIAVKAELKHADKVVQVFQCIKGINKYILELII
jgi:hypothetical protein